MTASTTNLTFPCYRVTLGRNTVTSYYQEAAEPLYFQTISEVHTYLKAQGATEGIQNHYRNYFGINRAISEGLFHLPKIFYQTK